MRKFIFTLVLAMLCTLNVQALEHSGYFRSGAASPVQNGCFHLPGARTKYRLGNECDSYLELALKQSYEFDDGSYLRGELMANAYMPYEKPLNTVSTGMPQFYLQAGKLFSSSSLAESSLWLGKRYYRRHDVHITDFFFWANSGTGLGIEDIRVASLRLAYAYKYNIVAENTPSELTISSHDFQIYDVKVGDAKLELGLELQQSSAVTDNSGLQLHMLYRQKQQDERFYELGIQYGEGVGANLDMNGASGQSWRLVGQWLFGQARPWQGSATLAYERQSDQQDWLSIGLRPVYYMDQHYSLALELGHDQVSPVASPLRLLNKASLALQWAKSKGFWQRPVYRAYVSYADWNQAAQLAGLADGTDGPYSAATEGLMMGLQVEVWW